MLIRCCPPSWSTTDIFASWGLSIDAATKITANKLNAQRNRSRCLLTCLSLALLQGKAKRLECLSRSAALREPYTVLYFLFDEVKENIAGLHSVIISWIIHLADCAFFSNVSSPASGVNDLRSHLIPLLSFLLFYLMMIKMLLQL